MKLVTVYGLRSTSNGVIRYVGQTNQKMKYRLHCHVMHAKANRSNSHVSNWIRRELDRGEQIQIFEIESSAIRNEAEHRLIAWYRKNGANLTNISPGGDGNVGQRSAAHRLAISNALKGKPKSQDHREKISAIMKGRSLNSGFLEAIRLGLNHKKGCKRSPPTAETRAKISEANRGRKFPPEHGLKIALSKIGKPRSQETKDKLSAYWTGRKLTPEQLMKRRATKEAKNAQSPV
jgi:hypothetical protein